MNVVILGLWFLLARQPTPTTPESLTPTTPGSGSSSSPSSIPGNDDPFVGLSGTARLLAVVVFALILIGVLVAATAYDMRAAYNLQSRRLKVVETIAARPTASRSESQIIRRIIGKPTMGIQGLTRGLLGLTILTIIALALAISMVSAGVGASDLRKTIVAALLGVLGTVIGFYFGSRTAETSADAASEREIGREGPGGGGGERPGEPNPFEAAGKAALDADNAAAEAKAATADAAEATERAKKARDAAHQARTTATQARAEADNAKSDAAKQDDAKTAEEAADKAEEAADKAELKAAEAAVKKDLAVRAAEGVAQTAQARLNEAKAATVRSETPKG